MQLAYETCSYILHVQFRQKNAINNAPQVRFSNATVTNNRTYASESAVNAVREYPKRNWTENEYSTVEEIDATGDKSNEATPNQDAKQVNLSGCDLARPQMKTGEDSEDYDHLEHFGRNKRPDEGHDSNDTYANAHTEGLDSNDTYSHVQSGQYFQTNFCTSGENWQNDDTYDHARNIRYNESGTYDHSRVFGHEGNGKLYDYAYAHSLKTSVKEGVYDHAGFDERNDNGIYE